MSFDVQDRNDCVLPGPNAALRVLFTLLAACFAGSAVAQDAPVLISRQALADDAFGRCVSGTDGRYRDFRESEAHAAVNPRDSRNIIAAWQVHGARGGAIQASASFDGGATWSPPHTLPINACAGGRYWILPRASDPWVAFGPEGRAYVGAIGYQASEHGPDPGNAIVVVPSPDGGRTWETPGVAAVSITPFRWHDNVAVVADPTRPGTAYTLTTLYEYPQLEDTKPGEALQGDEWEGRFIEYGPVGFSKTTDAGKTWSGVRAVTERIEGGRVSAPQMVVDPASGRLFAIYYRSDSAGAAVSFIESKDAGETWSAARDITNFVKVPEHKNPLNPEDTVVLAEDILQVDIDTKSSTIYVAFADGRFRNGKTLDVSLTHSTDEGQSWSAPIRVSSGDGETAWLPGLAVNVSGEIGVTYLTMDFTPREAKTAPVSVTLKVYAPDSKSLVEKDTRNLDAFNYRWPGDYLALVVTEGRFRLVYAKSTFGPEEAFPDEPTNPRGWNPVDVFIH